MNDIAFAILKIVVSVAVTLITTFVIPYIKNKLKEDKYAQLLDIIAVAVNAAEQTIKGDKVGPERKAEVLRFVSEWMTQHGIKIDAEQLNQLIESAVFEMKKEVA